MKKGILLLLFIVALGFALYAQTNTPWSEGFEGSTFPPTGWTKETPGSGNDITQSTTAHTGDYSARFSSYSSSSNYNQYLFTMQTHVVAGYDELHFWHKKYNSSSEQLQWGISTTTATSSAVSSWTDVSLSTDWQETVVDLSAYDGQNIYIAFHYYGDYLYYVYLDDVSVQAPPSCPAPNTLSQSNITTDSADLDWLCNSSVTTWQIEYGPTGFSLGSGTQVNGITSHPYTLSGLTANTTYDWYIRSDCGGSTYSDWEGPSTFTTKCNAVTSFPWTEDFTNWPPDCWDLTGGSASWDQYSNDPVYCARANYWYQSSGTTDIMTTPTLDVSSLTTPLLTFDWSHEYDSSYPDDALSVEVSDDNGATWTQVWYKTAADLDSGDGAGSTSPGSFVGSGNIDLSSFGNNILIRFYGTSGYGPNLFVDNVEVKEAPACPAPDNLSESNILNSSADLNWSDTGSPASWTIEYGPTGFTQGTGTTVNVNSHPYTLTGLTGSTTYDWYVQANCGLNGTSSWAGPHTFTTLADWGVDETCATTPKAGWKGATVKFTVNIANTGGNNDSYNLTIINNDYPAEWQDASGTTITSTSTINGGSNADYYVAVSVPDTATATETFNVIATSVGEPTIADTLSLTLIPNQPYGGPDVTGYTWKNSYATDGPTYDWIDLTSKTEVTGLGDDAYAGPFDIGFNFTFYGHTYTQFFIGSNGLITFGSGSTSLGNTAIPSTSSPDSLIAWFWDDLDPGDNPDGDTHVYYDKTLVGSDSCMVISFLNYHEYPGGGPGKLTAQVILFPNGNIKLQYQSFEGGIDMTGATVGIESEGGTDGLQYEYNENKLDNNMAIMFYAPATAIPTPTNLTITINGNDVVLGWDAVTGAASYNIYRATDPYGTFTSIATSATNSYTDTGAASGGTKYFYYVTASDSAPTLVIVPGKPKVVIDHYRK